MQLSETGVLTVEAAQNEFSAELIFLNTATMGLPPRRTLEAIRAALDVWSSGRASAVAYDDEVARARSNYAQLVGVDATARRAGESGVGVRGPDRGLAARQRRGPDVDRGLHERRLSLPRPGTTRRPRA